MVSETTIQVRGGIAAKCPCGTVCIRGVLGLNVSNLVLLLPRNWISVCVNT